MILLKERCCPLSENPISRIHQIFNIIIFNRRTVSCLVSILPPIS